MLSHCFPSTRVLISSSLFSLTHCNAERSFHTQTRPQSLQRPWRTSRWRSQGCKGRHLDVPPPSPIISSPLQNCERSTSGVHQPEISRDMTWEKFITKAWNSRPLGGILRLQALRLQIDLPLLGILQRWWECLNQGGRPGAARGR